MLVITPGGAPASGSERRVLDTLSHRGGPGVVYANFRITQNRRHREVDAFVMTPHGCVVVEVKGTAVAGLVKTPGDWPWSVDGRADAFKTSAGEANPGTQADTAAKMLATKLGAAGCNAGFVSSAVILDGPRLQLAGASDKPGGCATDPYVDNGVTKVLLVESVPEGLSFLRGRLAAPEVLEILTALEVPTHALPTISDLVDEGFALSVPPAHSRNASPRPGQPTHSTSGRATSPSDAGWSRWAEGPWTWGMKARAALLVFVAFSVVNDWLGDSQGSVEPAYRGTWGDRLRRLASPDPTARRLRHRRLPGHPGHPVLAVTVAVVDQRVAGVLSCPVGVGPIGGCQPALVQGVGAGPRGCTVCERVHDCCTVRVLDRVRRRLHRPGISPG